MLSPWLRPHWNWEFKVGEKRPGNVLQVFNCPVSVKNTVTPSTETAAHIRFHFSQPRAGNYLSRAQTRQQKNTSSFPVFMTSLVECLPTIASSATMFDMCILTCFSAHYSYKECCTLHVSSNQSSQSPLASRINKAQKYYSSNVFLYFTPFSAKRRVYLCEIFKSAYLVPTSISSSNRQRHTHTTPPPTPPWDQF